VTQYIHHVPGRLRVKALAFKNNERQVAQAKQHLERIEGILEVEGSIVTGSMVIRYDANVVRSPQILASLRERGFVSEHHPHSLGSQSAVSGPMAQALADKVVSKMVESVIERSAIALVAALI
jgi:hypothetical protein